MPLTFYPNLDEVHQGTLDEKIEKLMEGAQDYKTVILDEANKQTTVTVDPNKRVSPRDTIAAYNWEAIATVLNRVRELPELNKLDKMKKSDYLTKLAEIYEVLRAAKMSKLEAVRLAIMNEVTQLRGGSQVA